MDSKLTSEKETTKDNTMSSTKPAEITLTFLPSSITNKVTNKMILYMNQIAKSQWSWSMSWLGYSLAGVFPRWGIPGQSRYV